MSEKPVVTAAQARTHINESTRRHLGIFRGWRSVVPRAISALAALAVPASAADLMTGSTQWPAPMAGAATILASVLALAIGAGCWWWRVRHPLGEPQREWVRKLFEGEEAERTRLSRELRDGVCERLASVQNAIAQARGQPPGDPAFASRFAEVAQGIASSLEEAQRIARHLGPVEPGASGLKRAITALADEVSAAGKLRCFPELDGCEGTLSLAQKVRVYRLIEVGIGNVIAHGHASLVMIRIQPEARHLRIQLEDDRLGLDPGDTESALIRASGLERFRQRVLLLGGQFSVSVAPCGGARVCVQLPLESADG